MEEQQVLQQESGRRVCRMGSTREVVRWSDGASSAFPGTPSAINGCPEC
jgi:hypothetical protein